MKFLGRLLMVIGLALVLYTAYEIHYLLGTGLSGFLFFAVGVLTIWTAWVDENYTDPKDRSG